MKEVGYASWVLPSTYEREKVREHFQGADIGLFFSHYPLSRAFIGPVICCGPAAVSWKTHSDDGGF